MSNIGNFGNFTIFGQNFGFSTGDDPYIEANQKNKCRDWFPYSFLVTKNFIRCLARVHEEREPTQIWEISPISDEYRQGGLIPHRRSP